jgi:hypothetical protein
MEEILPFVELSSRKDNETKCGMMVKVSICAKVISVLDAIVFGITVDLSFIKLLYVFSLYTTVITRLFSCT